jgi:hypothetical protein
MGFKNLDGQTVRWIQHLQEYNFTSEHPQGQKHNNADALSQWPCQEECTQCHEVEAQADIRQVQAIAVVAAAGWDPVALRTELNNQDTGPILEEVETGQRPEWKDIADCRPMCKSYWAQGKGLAVSNGILQQQWESADDKKLSSSTSEHSERRADRTTWWTVGKSLGCQQDPK